MVLSKFQIAVLRAATVRNSSETILSLLKLEGTEFEQGIAEDGLIDDAIRKLEVHGLLKISSETILMDSAYPDLMVIVTVDGRRCLNSLPKAAN